MAILTNLQPNDVLFIDEIHRLNRTVEEVLYPAMEDGVVDIIIGKGPGAVQSASSCRHLPWWGHDKRQGMLTGPLRDRLEVIHRLEFYNKQELTVIVKRSARILGVEIDDSGAEEIAGRARGTPRVANRLLRRVRDYAQVKADNCITQEVAREALALFDVDQYGLDHIDRRLLFTIVNVFNGGPVGVDAIAAAISEEANTIEDVYEPYLLQLGFLQRTNRGRIVTHLGYQYLGTPQPHGESGKLFEA